MMNSSERLLEGSTSLLFGSAQWFVALFLVVWLAACSETVGEAALDAGDEESDGESLDIGWEFFEEESASDEPQFDVLEDLPVSEDPEVEQPEEDLQVEPLCPPGEELEEPAIGGFVYLDVDASAASHHAHFYNPNLDLPLGGVNVALLGPEQRSTVTCPNGRYSFGALPEGTYLLEVQLDGYSRYTSNNQPSRFAEAIREGQVTILTFGDSIPVYGASPNFPERLAETVSTLAEVTNLNVALSGSTTVDWLPESRRFNERLLPHLADADLVIMSLGGNDLHFYVLDAGLDPEDLVGAAAGFFEFLETVEERLLIIIEAIRAEAPQADILYIIYPNYAYSQIWADEAGEWIGLVISVIERALERLRRRMGEVDGIILADLYEATADIALDPLLSDPLHLSDEGTVFWARQVFLALGGAILGDEPLGVERMTALGE